MQSTILNFFAQRNRIVAHTTAGRARQCALELLVENGHVDVLENVFSKLSDIDVLHFSQVCRRWRSYSRENDVFVNHMKQLLSDNGLIFSSDELDTERAMLKGHYGPIDNINFYFYVCRRVYAAINKAHTFTRRLTHCFLGSKSLDKWTPPIFTSKPNERWQRELAFQYRDAALYEHLLAVGQPDGSITVIDLDSQKLHAEFPVYENTDNSFRWIKVLMNSKYIVCSSVLDHYPVKIMTHSGLTLATLQNAGSRPLLISDHKMLILSHTNDDPLNQLNRPNNRSFINLYDLNECLDVNDNEGLMSHARIKMRGCGGFPVNHFCANETIVVVEIQFYAQVHIYSLESQSRVAIIDDMYQHPFATVQGCPNYWFDTFEFESNTYLATLQGDYPVSELKVWKIDRAWQVRNNRTSRKYVHKLVNKFQLQSSCRITIKAENGTLAISLNDIPNDDYANNSIYAIPYDALVNDENATLHPICVFEDMITMGMGVSKSRIELLHCNGSISDLNYKDISEQLKLDLYQTHTAEQESQTDLLLESAFRSLKSLMKQRDVHSRRRLDSLRPLIDHTSSPFANVLPVMLVLYKNYGTQAKYFPNTNNLSLNCSPKPLLHRFRDFKRDVRVSTKPMEMRLWQLNGDNIMTVVSKIARPMSLDELSQMAIEQQVNDTDKPKRIKLSLSMALLDESMMELMGRARSFQQVFPQYSIYYDNYHFSTELGVTEDNAVTIDESDLDEESSDESK